MGDSRSIVELLKDGAITECNKCNAYLWEDDIAFAIETGTCPYCHQPIDRPNHVTSVEVGGRYRVIEDSEESFKPGDIVIALDDGSDNVPMCMLESEYDPEDGDSNCSKSWPLLLKELAYID